MKKACRFCFLMSLVLAVLPLIGCGGPSVQYGSLKLVEAKGTVTLNQQPLAGALVTFRGEDLGTSAGTTDENGRYVLMLNSQKSGVTPGEKTVIITTVFGEGPSEGEAKQTEKVPSQYNTKSTLKVVVEKKSKQEFDFDLTKN